jgi:hypothetical protein
MPSPHSSLPRAFWRMLVMAPLIFLPNVAGAQYVIPRKDIPAFMMGRAMGQALSGAIDAAAQATAAKIDLNSEIASARARFWQNFPNGRDREAAEAEFGRELFAKDLAYLAYYLPEGPYSKRGQVIKTLTGGDIDGGFGPGVQDKYNEWVVSIRYFFGVGDRFSSQLVVASPGKLLQAFSDPDVQKTYDEYKLWRDREEFQRAGHLKDFEALQAALRPAPVAGPPAYDKCRFTLIGDEEESYCKVQYGEVPEDFVPKITHELDSTEQDSKIFNVSIEMKKHNVDSLISIEIARRWQVPAVVCTYISDRGVNYRVFYYKNTPSSPPVFPPGGTKEDFGPPIENCPATFPEAKALFAQN